MGDNNVVNSDTESEDDVPRLPADTLAILKEFYREQNEKLKKEEEGEIGEDWVSIYCIIYIVSSNCYDEHKSTLYTVQSLINEHELHYY